MKIGVKSEGFIYYNDFLFVLLKRRHQAFITHSKKQEIKKIMQSEEIKTMRKLK